MYCIFFESILQRLYLNQKDNKSKPGFIYWRLSSGQSAEMVILLCPSMEFIYRVSSKTHFLNCRFAKPNLRVYGLSLPVGWKAIYTLQKFRKCLFWDTHLVFNRNSSIGHSLVGWNHVCFACASKNVSAKLIDSRIHHTYISSLRV